VIETADRQPPLVPQEAFQSCSGAPGIGETNSLPLRLERYRAQDVVFVRIERMTFVVDLSSLGALMSKRKPAMTSKHTPKIAAKAQRAAQAVVRSPKAGRPPPVETGSTEIPPKRHNDSKQEDLLSENPVTSLQQEAALVENPATARLVENPPTALQDDCKQTMMDSKKKYDFSSGTASVRTYQAKLLELAQANMQIAFEFTQRLAVIRSPVEFLRVIAEFSSKRIAMFQKYSTEMTELIP
jgi:hypothetical protein